MKSKGIIIAGTIVLSWVGSLYFLLTLPEESLAGLSLPGLIIQTMLFTGLFITAHDAMHGTIAPGKGYINDLFGTISVGIYALMSYKSLKSQHKFHHLYPGSEKDPDFHSAENSKFWSWYFRFVKHYISIWQIIGMALVFNILHHFADIPLENLLLFWVAPSLLSTLQLFYFGTYLPHRESVIPFPDQHRANSLKFPTYLSFITCFHFGGFHHEHHLYPGVPWWKLPTKKSTGK